MKQVEKRSGCAVWRHCCVKSAQRVRSLAAIVTKGLCLGLLAASFTPHPVAAADNTWQLSTLGQPSSAHEVPLASSTIGAQPVVADHPELANFEGAHKSRDAQRVADWVVDSGDNHGMPFLIVDKDDARVFVFYADGQLRGAAPALVGLARGDGSAPGIGNLKLSQIPPKERTTPAGRFSAFIGYNSHGNHVLWVDYRDSVSMHRVMSVSPGERRMQRIATPTPRDNRITYGCINVPARFFNKVVRPDLTGGKAIVYVLPDTLTIREVFPSYYDVRLMLGKRHSSGLQQDSKDSGR